MFPLEGIRVLDLSRAISGPYVGRMLADLGAEVVKVEVPGTDITQAFGPRSHGHTGLYLQQNAGKRNVSLDLGADGGAELLCRLAERADVVIENFRPGTLDRLGVGWSVLSKRNPRLVMLSVSGFGQWGPESGRQAYAPVLHAETGLLGRQAQVDGAEPNDVVMALADSVTSLHGMVAVLSALRLRDNTGTGQYLDMSMFEAMLATDDYTPYALEGTEVFAARGSVYADAPGGPLLVSGDPKFLWHRLSGRHGLTDPDPEVSGPERFTARARVIREWVASFGSRPELIAALEAAGVAWAEIRTPATVMESPTAQAREVTAQVDDRAGGTRPVIRMPYRFSAGSCEPRGGAAFVGEHNADVLGRWLGLDAARVRELEAGGTLIPADLPVSEAK
ncbi:CoA transferase [Pseudonocardia eucalypti]|uniref:CoA transferase n=1 Tax=Pseudonocardia eucalypti TaxID=648755 RepID=A0ABP9R296_9PSEU|nr:CoA:oxalate CoA-transferase [Pseudonocardia eucalypti]